MVAFKVEKFGGMAPRLDSGNLPDNMAEISVNCDLTSGILEGLPAPVAIIDLTGRLVPGDSGVGIRKAYRFPDPWGIGPDAWLALPSEFSSVVRSPLVNDSRIYWTAGIGNYYTEAGFPYWTTYADLIAGVPPWRLGIYQPPVGSTPTVTPVGGAAPNVYRSYCFTYVNDFGEESRPCTPTDVVSGPADAAWTITGLPTSVPANPVGINWPPATKVNLYRTLTGGATGGQFFLVTTFTIPCPASWVDPESDVRLASQPVMISSGWGNPPDYLDNLIALPGGMLVGSVGNTVHFCEPNRPHAWPAAYDQSLGYLIVGFGLWQQSLVVLTRGYPSTGSGNSPSNFIFVTVRTAEPCISRGSIVTDLTGVYYASQNGLIQLGSIGSKNNTEALVTRMEWMTNYNATKIVACRHRTQYLAVNNTLEGFLIDYGENTLGMQKLSTLEGVVSVWNDEYSGDTYVLHLPSKIVYLWDSPFTAKAIYRWRSKQFFTPIPINLAACQITIDTTADIGTFDIDHPMPLSNGDPRLTLPPGINAVFKLYRGQEQTLAMERNLTNAIEIFRLPSGIKEFTWQAEIISQVPITGLELATTMKELRTV